MIELWTTSTTEYLLYIENANILILTGLCIIHLGSLNHDGVCGEIDTPRECCSGTQNLNVTLHEHPLNQVPVLSQQSSIVNAKSEVKKFLHLFIARLVHLFLDPMRILTVEEVLILRVRLDHIYQLLGCAHGLGSAVHEYDDLFAHLKDPDKFGKYYVIHDFVCAISVSQIFDTIETAFQGSRSKARVEVESTLSISSNKLRDIFIVRKSSR